MSVIKISSRYARSFIGLSTEYGKLENVYSDFEMMLTSINNSPELQRFIKSPVIKADAKQKTLTSIFGKYWNELTARYVDLLISKGREPYLKAIIEEFVRQYNEIKGIVKVSLSSASPLSAETQNSISRIVQKATGANKIILKENVDPKLIGGFVINMGDKVYDASVFHKLQNIKKQLINA